VRTRLFLLPIIIANAAAVCAAQDGAKSSITTVTVKLETTVDLASKERPLAEVLEELARKMGYGKIHSKAPLEELTFDGKFEGKPAWECLTAVLKKHKLTFGGGEIGQDYALTLYPDEESRGEFRVSGGLVARFTQVPVGTRTRPPRRRPCFLEIRGEPRLGWVLKQVKVSEQKNAQGEETDLIGMQNMGGKPQMRFGKDVLSPWPGLSSFKVTGTAEFVTERLVADTTGLSLPQGQHPVKNKDEWLFMVEGIKREGRFVDIHISFGSTVKASSVAQGGWGFPVEDRLERQIGLRFELLGADGNRVSPGVLCFEGDGKRADVTFRVPPHKLEKAGGIRAVTLRFSKPLQKVTREFSFEFDLTK